MFSGRGVVFLGLNAVRALSLITLILVFASNIVVIVHDIQAVNRFVSASSSSSSSVDTFDNSTSFDSMIDCDYIDGSTVPNQPAGVFWAVVNRLLILFECIFLFLSEVGFPLKFFDSYFPVLGSKFGVGALGVFQCLIGASVLSHHIDLFALVAAFFLFSVGCLNILLGLIFREKSKVRRAFSAASLDLPFASGGGNMEKGSLKNGMKPFVIPTPQAAFPDGFTNVTHSTYSEKSSSSSMAPPYGSLASNAFGRAGSMEKVPLGQQQNSPSLLSRDLSLTRPGEAHPHPTPRVTFNGGPSFGSSPGSAV